uniref:Uncharacterized protein n=1 Tax=Caenorhabditis japonica TaxID=281687 RepID=A0A8R1HIZ1_CAEJA
MSAIADYIIMVYESVKNGTYQISTKEYFTSFEDHIKDTTWSPDDEDSLKMVVYKDAVQLSGKPNLIRFCHGKLVEWLSTVQAVPTSGGFFVIPDDTSAKGGIRKK